MSDNRIRGILATSHPVTYQRIETLACEHLRDWPINCTACWVCGVSIKGFKAKSMGLTIIGNPTMGITMAIRRPLWKRVFLALLRRADVRLFPTPYWTKVPVKVKAETRDRKSVQIGLIIVEDPRPL